jgi:uncharacterized membrane protein YphA (DoxX/SURF4 family)
MISAAARTSYTLLRLGVAFAFLYPPLSAFFGDPYTWFGYFPQWVVSLAASVGVSDLVLLHAFGVVELVIGIWILSGYKPFVPAMLGGIMLVGIVIFNLWQFEVLFRDLSIAAMCFALALMHWPRQRQLI